MNLELTKEEYKLLIETFDGIKQFSTDLSFVRIMNLVTWFEGNGEEIERFNNKLITASTQLNTHLK